MNPHFNKTSSIEIKQAKTKKFGFSILYQVKHLPKQVNRGSLKKTNR